MTLAFSEYCYPWRDILGVLTQTFEPASARLVMECLPGNYDDEHV